MRHARRLADAARSPSGRCGTLAVWPMLGRQAGRRGVPVDPGRTDFLSAATLFVHCAQALAFLLRDATRFINFQLRAALRSCFAVYFD